MSEKERQYRPPRAEGEDVPTAPFNCKCGENAGAGSGGSCLCGAKLGGGGGDAVMSENEGNRRPTEST